MKNSFVYVTYPTRIQAEKSATSLLKKKLIACLNLFPVRSMYRWKGKVVRGTEVVAVYKTKASLVRILRKEIAASHPYETPCIAVLSVDLNPAFKEWIDSETA